MNFDSLTDQGEWAFTASATSSHRDFDFLVGSWIVHNRKLKSRLTNCDEWTEFEFTSQTRSILNGFGNLDETGSTVRIFDPASRLWSIYGVGSEISVDLLKGSFQGDIANFFGPDEHEGKKVICQFQWDKTNPDAPIWSQALSADNGLTWEWNWVMRFSRQT